MSPLITKLGLLSLLSLALAAPIAPSDGLTVPSPARGAGQPSPSCGGRKHFRKAGKCSRSQINTAFATNGAQAARVFGTGLAYTTTTRVSTVYVEPSAAAAPAAASAVPAPAAEPSPELELSEKRVRPNAPAANTPPAAPVAEPVAAPAPSPAATPAADGAEGSAPAYNPGSGAKGGVAFTQPGQVSPFIGQSGISWCYNWNAKIPSNLGSGIEFVPTLWGTQDVYTNTWVDDANAAIAKGATAVVGFNEPDHAEQANLDYGTAAAAYKQHITANFAGKTKLVSPSVTNGGAPMGLAYLSNFMSACSDCGIQAINLHWYDSSSNIDYFKSYIQGAYEQFQLPIWLTEFGTIDGNDQAFLQEVLPWLASQPYVERHAYFMAEEGKLLSGGGLNGAGQAYAGA